MSEGKAGEDKNKAVRRDLALREWLQRLDATDRLSVAREGTNLLHELAAIANLCDGKRATVFPHPSGHKGSVISGLLSRRGWMAEALGISETELLPTFVDACQNPVAPRRVDKGACQEIVYEGDAVDLAGILPIPTHNEHDSGAYISAGLLICRNPRTGVQNVAIHRLQVSGPREMGVLLLPRHTLSFFQAAEAAGEDLDIAVVIGADPAALLASQAIVPIDFDEMGVAGALAGAPIEVVKCLGSEVLVPANAEIIIEGRLLARTLAPEGPFGEFPQYYGPRADRHVIAVDRITHRPDPLFHTIVGGGLEHLLLGGIPREASILTSLRRNFPNVRDVHLSHGGICRYHLHVQIEPGQPGGAKNIIMGAFAAHYDIKHVTVVDTDVNIHDAEMVEWAVATRFQADRDMVMIPGSQGSKLDPSTDGGLGCKTGFDATIPAGSEPFTFKRISVPGQEEIDLAAVLEPGRRLADLAGA
mgnify:CR=1 FL=1